MHKKVRWKSCSGEERDRLFRRLVETAGSREMEQITDPYTDVILISVFDVPMLRCINTVGKPKQYAYNADVRW